MINHEYRYMNIKTKQFICFNYIMDKVGTYFSNGPKDYIVVGYENVNDDIVVLCEEMLEVK